VIVRRIDPDVVWLKPTAPAIGLTEEYQPRTERVTLARGDMLFMYTDGVTEAVDQEEDQFGPLKLAEILKENSDLHPEQMIQLIRQELETFVGGRPLQDDTTFIALKILD
jgi:sigma-B regulation protein RsbU (phosphoserine phosphatase)